MHQQSRKVTNKTRANAQKLRNNDGKMTTQKMTDRVEHLLVVVAGDPHAALAGVQGLEQRHGLANLRAGQHRVPEEDGGRRVGLALQHGAQRRRVAVHVGDDEDLVRRAARGGRGGPRGAARAQGSDEVVQPALGRAGRGHRRGAKLKRRAELN